MRLYVRHGSRLGLAETHVAAAMRCVDSIPEGNRWLEDAAGSDVLVIVATPNELRALLQSFAAEGAVERGGR